jgi:hypothetical protein
MVMAQSVYVKFKYKNELFLYLGCWVHIPVDVNKCIRTIKLVVNN